MNRPRTGNDYPPGVDTPPGLEDEAPPPAKKSKRLKSAWAAFAEAVKNVGITAEEATVAITKAAAALVAAHKKPMNPKGGNDDIQTDPTLALAIVDHYKPWGHCLEPAAGDGAFSTAMRARPQVGLVTEFEIKRGDNFLTWENPKGLHFDWCITNVPWSMFRPFLIKCLSCCENIVFLDKINAWGTTARLNLIEEAGWEIVEKARVKQPKKPFPQMGMQLAAVHIRRGRSGNHLGHGTITKIDWTP